MTTQNNIVYPLFKAWVAGTGNPLVGGQLYTLIPGGSIGQYKTTYTDSSGNATNTNPVILNANGEAGVWGTGLYKLVLQDANSVQLFSVDNVPVSGGSGSSSTSTQWIVSGLTPTYISATQFSFTGDQRGTFQPGMRLQITETAGTVYFTISAVSYLAGVTTITVIADTNPIDTGLIVVNYGIVSVFSNTTSLPILPVNIQTANYTFVTTDNGQTFEFKANLSNTSCTVSNASPGVVTCANNGLAIGSQFIFGLGANGALPANVSANTIYYPITTGFVANTSFQFSNSNGGSAINTTGVTSSNVTISQCLTGALPTANTFPSNGTLEIKDVSAGLVTISGTIDSNANGITLTSLGYTKIYSDSNSWYTKLPQQAGVGVANLGTYVLSANANYTIPYNLSPGIRYKLITNLIQNANAGVLKIQFNGDTGSNYAFTMIEYDGSLGYTCVTSQSAISPTSALLFSDVNSSMYLSCEFTTFYGVNTSVSVDGSFKFKSASAVSKSVFSGEYIGGANLSSITIGTSAGTISGTATLYQLN